ncbi:MAG: hypothetical protein A4E61_01373 [Syntrophorhabdus sp. PtaB.Bin184]|jgi:hypothetical protein|nr:MAG: hypothetical protein A4E61_01373 [Syntrophorhabdus sp. PtaB.Bin184]
MTVKVVRTPELDVSAGDIDCMTKTIEGEFSPAVPISEYGAFLNR